MIKKIIIISSYFISVFNLFQSSAQNCIAGDCQNGYGFQYVKTYSNEYTIESCFKNSNYGYGSSSQRVPVIWRYSDRIEITLGGCYLSKPNSDERITEVILLYDGNVRYIEKFITGNNWRGQRQINFDGSITITYINGPYSGRWIDEKNPNGITAKNLFEQRLFEARQLITGFDTKIFDVAESKQFKAGNIKVKVDINSLIGKKVLTSDDYSTWSKIAFKLQDNNQLAEASSVWNQIYLKYENIDARLNAIWWKSHCEEDLMHIQIALEDLKTYEKLYEKSGKNMSDLDYINCTKRLTSLYEKSGNQEMSNFYSQRTKDARNGKIKSNENSNNNDGMDAFVNVFFNSISSQNTNQTQSTTNNGQKNNTQTKPQWHPCDYCNKYFDKPYLKDCTTYANKETKPGYVLCGGCHGYGYLTTNVNCGCNNGGWCYEKQCYVNGCVDGWYQCRDCNGKGQRFY